MPTDKYFKELSACLNKLSDADRLEAISFYTEYSEEAHLITYEALVQRFGTPKKLASKIYADMAVKNLEGENKKIGKAFLLGAVALFSLPFSFPFIIAAVSILFAWSVAAVAILFSLGVTIFALIKASIWLFIKSFTFLSPFIPVLWLKALGGSLILIAVAAVILCILIFAVKLLIKLSTILMSKTVKRRTEND